MTLRLASPDLPARQVLVRGRLGEAITGRGLRAVAIELHALQGTDRVPLPAQVVQKPGGWYAAHVTPGRHWPAFADAPEVTLEIRVTLPGRMPVILSQAVPAAGLQPEPEARTVAGQAVLARLLPGAPWRLDLTVDPAPVALEGTVIRADDPAEPAVGVGVTVLGQPPVITDGTGRFFLPELPVLARVVLSLDDGGPAVQRSFTPDYDRRVNRVTLSLGGA